MIGEISGLASAAAWALVSTVMRSMSDRVNPITVNGLRCAFGAANMAILIVILGRVDLLQRMPALGVALVVISGLIGQGLGDAIFVVSMKRIGAARAMPISSIQPLITTALAVVFLGERVTWFMGGGTLLVLAGVYLLAFPYGPLSRVRQLFASADRLGLALALGTAGCWAVSAVILKAALDSIDVLSAALVRMAVAAILLFGFQIVASREKVLAGLNARGFAVMVVAGLLGTGSALGYVTALNFAGAAKAAVLASTTPFFGLPLSIFVLRERVNSRVVLGSLLCVFGIWMVLMG